MRARVLIEVVVAHWTGKERQPSSVQNGFSIRAKTPDGKEAKRAF